MNGRLAGRIALITGAARGLGAAVARRFAAEGAHTVLLARSESLLAEQQDAIAAAGGTAILRPLDLCDLDAIDALGPSLLSRFGGLDLYVGAAAELGPLTPLAHLSAADWERALTVNLTAQWRLMRTLDPLLRRAAAGRAILVTCEAGLHARPYWGGYAVAKAGLEMLAQVWAEEARKSPLRVNLLDPGPLATRLRAEAFPGEDARLVPAPESVADAFLALADGSLTETGRRYRAAELMPQSSRT